MTRRLLAYALIGALTFGAGCNCFGGPAGFSSAASEDFPTMQSNGGKPLMPVNIVSIVVGDDPLASNFFSFADGIGNSNWWSSMTNDYDLGTTGSSVHVTGPETLSTSPADIDMQNYVWGLINAGTAPQPDGNSVYVLYLPEGTLPADGGGCVQYLGYHELFAPDGDTNPLGDDFAVVVRCTTMGQAEVDTETVIASHEIAESTTDPNPPTGVTMEFPASPFWTATPWTWSWSDEQIEVGDLCAGTQWRENGFLFQRIWSPSGAQGGTGDPCGPPAPDGYYAVSASQPWYTVDATQQVAITLTGWSNQEESDWQFIVFPVFALPTGFDPTTFQFTVTGAMQSTVGGEAFSTVNNGSTATLTVTAPGDAAPGTVAVFLIESLRTSTFTTTPLPDTDLYHTTYVGVYVPYPP